LSNDHTLQSSPAIAIKSETEGDRSELGFNKFRMRGNSGILGVGSLINSSKEKDV
jgi:hypothetical protein